MSNLNPKTFSRIVVCAAVLLVPLMTYGSALLVYSQMNQVEAKHSQQPKAATKVALSRQDSEQIAAAIEIASRG